MLEYYDGISREREFAKRRCKWKVKLERKYWRWHVRVESLLLHVFRSIFGSSDP